MANRWFWLLCVATSTSSVVILLVLLLSIVYQGATSFAPNTADLDAQITELDAEIKALTGLEDEASKAKREELTDKLQEVTEYREEVSKFFLTKTASPDPRVAGIGPALMGSIWVCVVCAMVFIPLGVGTAILLEEFKPRSRWLQYAVGFLQLNISNLAGVPSIVYGILGLTAFASMFGLFGTPMDPVFELGATYRRQFLTVGEQVVFVPVTKRNEVPELFDGLEAVNGKGEIVALNIIGEDDDWPEDDALLNRSLLADEQGGVVASQAWYSFRLPFGRSVLAASLTLVLVILPVVIIATQEALRSVPSSLRQGAQGLGCTPWQVVRFVTLPSAIPGIMTGVILAMSRAIGEAAPILLLSGIVSIPNGPKHLMDKFSILPLQIFYWAAQPRDPSAVLSFQEISAGAIIVLLVVLFAFNSIAIFIRQAAQKQLT